MHTQARDGFVKANNDTSTLPNDAVAYAAARRAQVKEARQATTRRWQRIERAILLPVLAFVFMGLFVFKMGQVQGKSMEPLYTTDDHLLIFKPWQLSPLHPGDIVVVKLNHGKYKGEQWVKRVMYVQNAAGNAPWSETVQTSVHRILPKWWFKPYVDGQRSVPANNILVMGDNVYNSTDSRDDEIGAIAPDEIQGKVIQVWTTDKNYQASVL